MAKVLRLPGPFKDCMLVFLLNVYIEASTLNVMAFGDGAWGGTQG